MRIIHRIMAIVESAVAIILIVLAFQVPGEETVSTTFGRVSQVSTGTEKQVALIREQVGQLERQDFSARAERLRQHTKTVSDSAIGQQVNFDTINALAQSLGDVSKGIRVWSDTLDLERMKTVSKGFSLTADMLDRNVTVSEKAANEVDSAVKLIAQDGLRLAELLKKAPPDLKVVQVVYEGLGTFDAGLEKLDDLMKAERVEAIKEGLTGLDESITGTANQVESLGKVTYPVMTINGFKPNIETKPFWPEAPKIAEGLKKASTGVQATNKEFDRITKSLPEMRKALAESRKSIVRSRESVGTALKQQAETEKLLQAIPKEIAELAEAIPNIGKSFSSILRETKKLKELATALRTTQAILDENLKRWPEIAEGLKKSATVLEQAQIQLRSASKNREQYERAMASTTQVAKSFADLLPEFTEQLDHRLEQQHRSLLQMEKGLAELNGALPQAERQTLQIFTTIRCLMWLVGAMIFLHAITMFRTGKQIA